MILEDVEVLLSYTLQGLYHIQGSGVESLQLLLHAKFILISLIPKAIGLSFQHNESMFEIEDLLVEPFYGPVAIHDAILSII